ncbi:MAG: thiol peroxidase [Calditrichaeota bacterium]|nr:thiol peroxidase [Calditrichota bacterium]
MSPEQIERKGITTMHGNPLTLVGPEIQVGQKAPDFVVLDNDLNEKTLADYAGKVKLLSVVPSLDTPVCDMQTRRFNELASELGENVVILTISMDLPFAQARWCAAAGVDRVATLSDHRDASFGQNYGVLIKELRLLNRSIFVVDDSDVVRYVQIVKENTEHPNYDEALGALRQVL